MQLCQKLGALLLWTTLYKVVHTCIHKNKLYNNSHRHLNLQRSQFCTHITIISKSNIRGQEVGKYWPELSGLFIFVVFVSEMHRVGCKTPFAHSLFLSLFFLWSMIDLDEFKKMLKMLIWKIWGHGMLWKMFQIYSTLIFCRICIHTWLLVTTIKIQHAKCRFLQFCRGSDLNQVLTYLLTYL